jgi:hypothetical protein
LAAPSVSTGVDTTPADCTKLALPVSPTVRLPVRSVKSRLCTSVTLLFAPSTTIDANDGPSASVPMFSVVTTESIWSVTRTASPSAGG